MTTTNDQTLAPVFLADDFGCVGVHISDLLGGEESRVKSKGLENWQYRKIIQRFNMPMARHTEIVSLVADMFAACVVTMGEFSPEQIAEFKSRIDSDYVRVLQ